MLQTVGLGLITTLCQIYITVHCPYFGAAKKINSFYVGNLIYFGNKLAIISVFRRVKSLFQIGLLYTYLTEISIQGEGALLLLQLSINYKFSCWKKQKLKDVFFKTTY